MSGQSSNSNQLSQTLASMFSNSGSNNKFGQQVSSMQSPALQDLYTQARDMFTNTQGGVDKAVGQSQDYINNVNQSALPAWQQQLGGGAYAGVDANDIYSQLKQSMGQPSNTSSIYAGMMGGEGNNYADAMKSKYMADADRAQKQMMSNIDARAGGTGMVDSSRAGVSEALGMRDINQNLQGNMAQVGYETFDKDLQNKLGIAQQADSNTLQRQQMLQGMLGQKQQAMQGGLQGSSQMQNLGMGSFAPLSQQWQGLNNYQQAIGSPLVLNSGQGSSFANAGGNTLSNSSARSKSGGGGI